MIQQLKSHLVLQVVLSVHLVIWDVKVVVGVVVLKHTAGGRRKESAFNPTYSLQYYVGQKQRRHVRTYNSLIPYGPMTSVRGGEAGGGGGEESPRPWWWWWWWPLVLPRVVIFWKLMSVCVALSTQSGIETMAPEEMEVLPLPLPLHMNVPEGRRWHTTELGFSLVWVFYISPSLFSCFMYCRTVGGKDQQGNITVSVCLDLTYKILNCNEYGSNAPHLTAQHLGFMSRLTANKGF